MYRNSHSRSKWIAHVVLYEIHGKMSSAAPNRPRRNVRFRIFCGWKKNRIPAAFACKTEKFDPETYCLKMAWKHRNRPSPRQVFIDHRGAVVAWPGHAGCT